MRTHISSQGQAVILAGDNLDNVLEQRDATSTARIGLRLVVWNLTFIIIVRIHRLGFLGGASENLRGESI